MLYTDEYQNKCESLLSDTSAYKKLGKRDPTSKHKKKLVTVLQRIQLEGGIDNTFTIILLPEVTADSKNLHKYVPGLTIQRRT